MASQLKHAESMQVTFWKREIKKREKKIETDVPVVSGETDKNPKSERSY
jgi:hypothetical protein